MDEFLRDRFLFPNLNPLLSCASATVKLHSVIRKKFVCKIYIGENMGLASKIKSISS